ncbi:hypothetical protein GC102_20915 [Paenibacillus sp. LMG 31460]|uniref:DUF6597 domain-containing protein n=1 Tax=Paenibacillus germinis TaxID=2654979 RepID=A0ABX1Z4M7_9BACL|nr:DUF6597 domain-containing transcriptional factor [Paenibacillus germinis]NOU88211.1 hypothetical protein [Paenibacillus germinis]
MAAEIKPIGMLNNISADTKFKLSVFRPSEDLAFFVENYWIVQWDLCGEEPFLSKNLPHPSVHMVFGFLSFHEHFVVVNYEWNDESYRFILYKCTRI